MRWTWTHSATALGLAGAASGAVAGLDAAGVESTLSTLHPSGREGPVPGAAALALAALGAAAAALAARRPGWSTGLTFLAAAGGFLAVGPSWAVAGALLGACSATTFALLRNPFAAEIAGERRGGGPGV